MGYSLAGENGCEGRGGHSRRDSAAVLPDHTDSASIIAAAGRRQTSAYPERSAGARGSKPMSGTVCRRAGWRLPYAACLSTHMLIPVLAESTFALYKNFLPGACGENLRFWNWDLGFKKERRGRRERRGMEPQMDADDSKSRRQAGACPTGLSASPRVTDRPSPESPKGLSTAAQGNALGIEVCSPSPERAHYGFRMCGSLVE